TTLLTILEQTAVGDERERRVLFDTGEDVDLPVIALSAIDRLDVVAPLLARGYRVIVDKIGLEEHLERLVSGFVAPGPPTQRELMELASDFWYHALWAAKKLRRGEVFTAKGCLDGYM